MAKVINLKKGLDIPLQGEALKECITLPLQSTYAVVPAEFKGLSLKPIVKEGDQIKVGGALLFDKAHPDLYITSPVSGTVSAIVRGEKRKILRVEIQAHQQQHYETFQIPDLVPASRSEIVRALLQSGLWPMIIQRPYGIVANPEDQPKAIFISGFDSAPLASDLEYVLGEDGHHLQVGLKALGCLTQGQLHLSLREGHTSQFASLQGVELHTFKGPHPVGNVGVQVHHIDPLNKGERVWTLHLSDVALMGRFFTTGRVDMIRTIALTGSEAPQKHYVQTLIGTPISALVQFEPDSLKQKEVRIINGNVLTGTQVERSGYLGYYTHQVTMIPEGNRAEFLGWMMPRWDKFSVSKSYLSWLRPGKRYALDANLNGGVRAYVITGLYEKYLPMDLYPMHLLKAILAEDIEKMENLGIYEVIEEDFALCEFVDPSKNDMQQTIRQGIELMIKEN